jgi:uridylate kinase
MIIISLGGSLIYPDPIDTDFIIEFKKLIESYLHKEKFVIICGGGKLCRNFNEALSKIRKADNEEKDWMGIAATNLNAHLIKSIFDKKEVYEHVISDPTKKIVTDKKIIVCSGWKPGCSTDNDAVLLAKNLGVKKIINMSNIEYVYDSDPKKNPNAKPIEKMSWKTLIELVGDKWIPGLNMPFDPIAAKESQKQGFQVYIIGKDLKNLKNLLDGKKFKGTLVS